MYWYGVCTMYMYFLQPSLNEQPQVEGGKKRPANDENIDPSTQPPAKQPKTIDIDLPNRWEDYSTAENTAKGIIHCMMSLTCP